MVDILFVNTTIVTMNKNREIIKNGAIAIDGGRILDVGDNDEILSKYGEGDEVIDGSGMLAIPGLINAHTHTFQVLLRGLGDDMELVKWLNSMLFPAERAARPEDVRVAALLACLEMIKTGTTFFIDHHFANTSEKATDNIAKSIEESGIKGLIARGMQVYPEKSEKLEHHKDLYPYTIDEEIELTEKLIQKWHGKADGRISACPAPVAPEVMPPDMFTEAKKISQKYKVPIHMHLSESRVQAEWMVKNYGKRPVEFLLDLGVLGPNFHIVHGVWLDKNEIKIIAETKTNLIHCPVANMYLASGTAPIPELLKAGANVALASDGPASNNNQDMIGVMKTAALLHKVSTLNPEVMPCEQVLEMATIGGARALGLEREIGSIEPGKKADVVLVDIKKPHISPIHRAISALVYCASGTDVDTVIVNGKIVLRDKKIKTLDEKTIVERAQEIADDLVGRAEIAHLKMNNFQTWLDQI